MEDNFSNIEGNIKVLKSQKEIIDYAKNKASWMSIIKENPIKSGLAAFSLISSAAVTGVIDFGTSGLGIIPYSMSGQIMGAVATSFIPGILLRYKAERALNAKPVTVMKSVLGFGAGVALWGASILGYLNYTGFNAIPMPMIAMSIGGLLASYNYLALKTFNNNNHQAINHLSNMNMINSSQGKEGFDKIRESWLSKFFTNYNGSGVIYDESQDKRMQDVRKEANDYVIAKQRKAQEARIDAMRDNVGVSNLDFNGNPIKAEDYYTKSGDARGEKLTKTINGFAEHMKDAAKVGELEDEFKDIDEKRGRALNSLAGNVAAVNANVDDDPFTFKPINSESLAEMRRYNIDSIYGSKEQEIGKPESKEHVSGGIDFLDNIRKSLGQEDPKEVSEYTIRKNP